jgi:ATP-dependent DNA helicase DinG
VLRLRGFAGEPALGRVVRAVLDDLLLVLDGSARGWRACGASWTRTERGRRRSPSCSSSCRPAEPDRHAPLRCARRSCPVQEAVPLVRWLERRGREEGSRMRNIAASAAPIDLADLLRDALFDRVHTTCSRPRRSPRATASASCARGSASTAGARHRVRAPVAVRLRDADDPRVPTDAPTARRAAALRCGRRRDHRGSRAADGRRAVRAVHVLRRAARRGGELHRRGAAHARWPLFVQGEAPRAALLQRFTDAHRGILLGVASFWEGVDVPGDPLRGLIITKLPFKVPSEPLTAARIEAIDAMAATASTTTCCRTPRCG